MNITNQDGRSVDRRTLEYIRKNSIERWLAGEKPLDIIRSFTNPSFCDTTIYKWIKIYEEGGMEALESSKAPGAKSKLTEAQQEQLREMIVGKEPQDHGLEFNLWTRKIIAELIRNEFDVDLGLTQIGVLLAKLRITPQKPVRQAREQDPEEVQEWESKTFPEILNGARNRGAEVFFLDEAGFRLDDQVGRTWGPCGDTPVVPCSGKRSRLNSIIAMSINGAFWYDEFDENLNSKVFCGLLDQFMQTRRKEIVLIMDKHPAHTSNFTTEFMAGLSHKLKVRFLPGYSPELNPVEYVNHVVKAVGPRKYLAFDKTELYEIVEYALSSFKGAFSKVKSFFKHRKLSYIHSLL